MAETLGVAPTAVATDLASLDGVLVLRAYSGPYRDDSQRTMTTLPEVVVFDDGRVAADVSPFPDTVRRNYRSLTLTGDELTMLQELLMDAAVVDSPLTSDPDLASSDAGVTIIQARIPRGDVEIAVLGLETRLDHVPDGVPTIAVRLDKHLSSLWERARSEGSPWFGDLPQVRILPHVGGLLPFGAARGPAAGSSRSGLRAACGRRHQQSAIGGEGFGRAPSVASAIREHEPRRLDRRR